MAVSSPELTDRQMADYYWLIPKFIRRQSKLFQKINGMIQMIFLNLDSIIIFAELLVNQLNYSDDEKKAIYLFSQQFNENFATGISNRSFDECQVALIACFKKLPGISISTSWDRERFETSLIYCWNCFWEIGPSRRSGSYLKKRLLSLNDRVGTSYALKNNTKKSCR